MAYDIEMSACTIYLVRHGQTDANAHEPPILQGNNPGYELNDVGVTQAKAAARVLCELHLSAIYASPLKRAQHTARLIAEPYGLDVSTVEPIHEVDVGDWEGLSWNEVMARHAQQWQKIMLHGGERPYPGGESYLDVTNRAVPALMQLAARHAGESIAVVAHRVVNRCVAASLMGLDVRRSRDLPQDNGAINVLRGDGQRLKLITLNGVAHLS